jgi:hypothetical protein
MFLTPILNQTDASVIVMSAFRQPVLEVRTTMYIVLFYIAAVKLTGLFALIYHN